MNNEQERSTFQEKMNIENQPVVERNKDLLTALEASIQAGNFLRDAYFGNYDIYVKEDKSEYTPFDAQAEVIAFSSIRETEPNAIIMSEEIFPDQNISEGDYWVIDGIDGTTNFSRRIPICNFTLAKVEAGKIKIGVVNDFLNKDLYYAVSGQGAYKNGKRINISNRELEESVISFAPLRPSKRGKWDKEDEAVYALRNAMDEITDKSGRFHREFQSGGLELAWVAEGKLDGYASAWTSPWDLSAGVLLVKESGGIATNIYGESWEPSYLGVIAGNSHVQPHILDSIQKNFNR